MIKKNIFKNWVIKKWLDLNVKYIYFYIFKEIILKNKNMSRIVEMMLKN